MCLLVLHFLILYRLPAFFWVGTYRLWVHMERGWDCGADSVGFGPYYYRFHIYFSLYGDFITSTRLPAMHFLPVLIPSSVDGCYTFEYF
jgi:hypothetical protein